MSIRDVFSSTPEAWRAVVRSFYAILTFFWATTYAQTESASNVQLRLKVEIESVLAKIPEFKAAWLNPNTPGAKATIEWVKTQIGKLETFNEEPPLRSLQLAERRRCLAYLATVLARHNRALAQSRADGMARENIALAETIMEHVGAARQHIAASLTTSDDPEARAAKIRFAKGGEIYDNLSYMEAYAAAVLASENPGQKQIERAKMLWESISVSYRSLWDPPPPEVQKLYDLPKMNPMTIVWIGVCFAVAVCILAVVIPNPTVWQMFVFRGLFSVACAAIATQIPGLLNVNLGNYITAAGALAVFVIIYRVNPPEFARNSLRGS